MYTLSLTLAVITLILGVLTLSSGLIARLPLWLRLFDLIVGSFMTLYSIWAMFFAADDIKIAYPTILYVIPFMAVILSILYNHGRISYGLKDFEQTFKVQKVKKPKEAKVAKLKEPKQSRISRKEQKALENAVAEEVKIVAVEANEIPAKPVNKTYITGDGKPTEFKLPDLF